MGKKFLHLLLANGARLACFLTYLLRPKTSRQVEHGNKCVERESISGRAKEARVFIYKQSPFYFKWLAHTHTGIRFESAVNFRGCLLARNKSVGLGENIAN